MPRLPASNNESPRFPTNNNEDVQKTATKQSPSYYGVTIAPNISDPLIFGLSTLDVHSRESKCTTRNKDNPTLTTNAATKKQNEMILLSQLRQRRRYIVVRTSVQLSKTTRINETEHSHASAPLGADAFKKTVKL